MYQRFFTQRNIPEQGKRRKKKADKNPNFLVVLENKLLVSIRIPWERAFRASMESSSRECGECKVRKQRLQH